MPTILNLGGEGEQPDAIDINSLIATRRRPATFVRPGMLIQADFRALPIRPGSVDEIVGNDVPMRLDREDDVRVATEAFDALRSGGNVRVQTSVADLQIVQALRSAGFADVKMDRGYTLGKKP